jgi:hypothetical protein
MSTHMQDPFPAPATVTVRCSGHMHQITFKKGRLLLLNHPHIQRDKSLFAFGARCRCLEVLTAWQQRLRYLLPDGLKPAFDGCHDRRMERRKQRFRAPTDASLQLHTMDELKYVARSRAVVAINAALSLCDYRRTTTGRHTIHIKVGGRPDVKLETQRPGRMVASGLGQIAIVNSNLFVSVGFGWPARVEARGLEVVDRRLVLDVVTQHDLDHYHDRRRVDVTFAPWWIFVSLNHASGKTATMTELLQAGPLVLYARQEENGLSTYPWPALVRYRDGVPHLDDSDLYIPTFKRLKRKAK